MKSGGYWLGITSTRRDVVGVEVKARGDEGGQTSPASETMKTAPTTMRKVNPR